MSNLDGKLFTLIVLEIFKLNGILVQEGDHLTKDQGLSSARWKILSAVILASSPLTVSQIAHAMSQSRQGVLRLTNAMVKEGIILYKNNPNHKRAKILFATEKGQEIYKILQSKQVPWADQCAEKLKAADLQTTLSTLRQISRIF